MAWRRWAGTIAALLTGFAAVVALVVLAVFSQQRKLGQQLDQAGMDAVYANTATARRLVGLLGTISVGTLTLVVVLLVGQALLRRRYAAAVAAIVVIGGANVSTQLLKRLIDRSDFGMLTYPSLPSGHTTVMVSVVIAALIVAPLRIRRLVPAVGSLAIVLTGAATLAAGWHRPADVLAALLVGLAWGCLAVVAWGVFGGGSSPDHVRGHGRLALLGMLAAAAVVLALGVRPLGGWPGAFQAGLVLALIGLASAAIVRHFADLSAPFAAAGPAPRRQDARS